MTEEPMLDLLGLQLINVVNFITGNFNKQNIFEDHIMQESLSADEMFYRQRSKWLLRTDSLPTDETIKAIAFSRDEILIETSLLDDEIAERKTEERKLSAIFDPKGRRFTATDGTTLISYTKPKRPKVDDYQLDPRLLWTIPFSKLSVVQRRDAIAVIDAMYSTGALVTSDETLEMEGIGPRKFEIKQRLNLDLRLKLKLEQRAVLAVQATVKTSLELQGILAVQAQLLKLGPEQLEEFVLEQLNKRGEKETARILDFVLAGKVKKVKPDLTWKQARQVARQLTQQIH